MRNLIPLILTLLILQAHSLEANIQTVPDTVGQDAVMTLSITPGVSVPSNGGFTIGVPSKFKTAANGEVTCSVADQAIVQLLTCVTLSESEVQATLAASVQANVEIVLDISTF